MKKTVFIFLVLAMVAAMPALLKAQGSAAMYILPGFLSMATTGSAGCTTLGVGNPPCWVPWGTASNPIPIATP